MQLLTLFCCLICSQQMLHPYIYFDDVFQTEYDHVDVNVIFSRKLKFDGLSVQLICLPFLVFSTFIMKICIQLHVPSHQVIVMLLPNHIIILCNYKYILEYVFLSMFQISKKTDNVSNTLFPFQICEAPLIIQFFLSNLLAETDMD